jgi:uroporphyrinogen-III synthase
MSDAPLAGRRVLVTRPTLQASELVTAIERAGGEAVRFPVIGIVPRNPEMIRAEFASAPWPDIVVFISRNAVDNGLFAVSGCNARIAAVGAATAAALEAQGVRPDIVPAGGADTEHLLQNPSLQNVSGRVVMIVRGQSGRELLADTLRERGARVVYLPVYERVIHKASAAELAHLGALWRDPGIDCVTIMSADSIRFLLRQLPPDLAELLRKTPLVAPGSRVLKTACELVPGIPATMASGPSAADMVNAVIEALDAGQDK